MKVHLLKIVAGCAVLSLLISSPGLRAQSASPTPSNGSISVSASPSPSPSVLPSTSPLAGGQAGPSPSPSASPKPVGLPPTGSLYDTYKLRDLETMSLEELEISLSSLGLSTKGTKAELLERLKSALRVSPPPSSSPSPSQSVSPSPTPESSPSASTDSTNQSGADASKKPSGVAAPVQEVERVVTIESAGSATNFTIEGSDDSYIKLSGGVSLLVDDAKGSSKHHIVADEIVFNRDKQVMTARGNVTYDLVNGADKQKFEGQELQFDLETSGAVFLDGVALNKQTIKGNTLDFRIVGSLITRTSKDLIILDNADLSSSPWDPPAYKITARKIRILKPGEWVIEEGVLFVGRVPMFYIPFFYSPGDDIIFHPVAGYRNIEGAFVQTTTYLIGRKPESTQPFSLLQINSQANEGSYDLVPRGLFLEKVKTGAGKTVDDDYLKLLIDGYTNLGAFLGVQGKFTDTKVLQNFSFTGVLGFSRALYLVGGSTYANAIFDNGVEISNFDGTRFFGIDLPFRFAFDLDLSLNLDPAFKISLKLPLLSDPTILSDVMNRAEDMDWGNLIGISDSSGSTTGTSSVSSRDSLLYQLNLGLSPTLGDLGPFISSFSISRLTTSWNWISSTWSNPPEEISSAARSGEKRFFIPSDLTLPDVSLALSGELLKFPWPAARPKSPATTPEEPEKDDNPAKPGTSETTTEQSADIHPDISIAPPWEDQPTTQDEKVKQPDASEASNEESSLELAKIEQNQAPQLFSNSTTSSSSSAGSYSLAYSIAPSETLKALFPKNITDPYSLSATPDNWRLDTNFSGSLTSTFSSPLRIVTMANGLSYSYQNVFPFNFADTLTAAQILDLQTKGAQGTLSRVSQTNSVNLYPLFFSDYFSGSQLSYSLNETLYQKTFASMSGSDAVFTEKTVDWTKEYITTHTAGATFAFKYGNFGTSLGGTVSLPPTAERLTASFNANYSGYTFSTGITFNKNASDAYDPDPINLDLYLPFFDRVSLKQTLKIDTDLAEATNYVVNLSLWDLSASLTATKAYRYKYQVGTGFVQDGDNVFQASNISIAYKLGLIPEPLWKQRITTRLDANISYDQNLLQVTGSTLNYGLTWALQIYQFMDLNFTVSGQNVQFYRYIPALSETVGVSTLNILEDLAKSFNFFDEADRRASNFDMKNLALKITHYLGDWQLDISYSGSPIVKTSTTDGTQTIDWNDSFALSIAWKPIPEIRKDISIQNDVTTIK